MADGAREVRSVTQLVEDLLSHAALAGDFDPYRYLPKDLERATEARVLSEVGRDCDEVFVGGHVLWRLRETRRRQQLRKLIAADRVRACLRRWPPLHDDAYARQLDACLKGTLEAAGDVPDDALEAAVTATAAAIAVTGDDEHREHLDRHYRELRRRLAGKTQNRQFDTILPTELYGRVAEKALADRFIDEGGVAGSTAVLPESDAPAIPERALLITGTPGSGKSAFVTDLVRRHKDRGKWVFLLDFDRPVLALGGELAWLEDLTRHIGYAEPHLSSRLSDLRGSARQELTSLAAEGGYSSSANSSAVAHLRRGLIEILRDTPAQPLVLVLDTFEEVIARSPRRLFAQPDAMTVFHQVMAFAAQLSSLHPANQSSGSALFPSVRLVVSGRVPPPLDAAELARWFCGHLDMPDLDPEAARALLKARAESGNYRLRNNDRRLDRAVGIIGGHPLNLILFERHVRDMKAAEIDNTLTDLERDGIGSMSGEAGTRALYNRFLGRIRYASDLPPGVSPQAVAKLAHPGLVLREIDEALLTEVIAPAVGIDFETDTAAVETLDVLADQVWLVSVASEMPLRIRHRPDVRAIMLPMMIGEAAAAPPSALSDGQAAPGDGVTDGGPAETDRRDEIWRLFENGIAYYAGLAARGLPGAATEAGYLHALRGDVDVFEDDPDLAASVAQSAAHDLDLMIIEVRALLKFHSEGAASLGPDEIAALPATLRGRADAAVGDLESRTGTGAAKVARARSTGSGRGRRKGFSPPMEQAASTGGEPPAESPPEYARISEALMSRTLGDRIATAFRDGDFSAVIRMGLTALGGVSEFDWDAIEDDRIVTDLKGNWLWLTALAALPERAASDRLVSIFARNLGDHFRRTEARHRSRTSKKLIYLVLIAHRQGSSHPRFLADFFQSAQGLIQRVIMDSEAVSLADIRFLSYRFIYSGKGSVKYEQDGIRMNDFRFFDRAFIDRLVLIFLGNKSDDYTLDTLVDLYNSTRATTKPGGFSPQDMRSINYWSSSTEFSLFGDFESWIGMLTMPELHDAVTNALLRLEHQHLIAFVDALSRQAIFWPEDIGTDALGKYAPDISIFVGLIGNVVLHADRCGLLRHLILQGADTDEAEVFGDLLQIHDVFKRRFEERHPAFGPGQDAPPAP